MGEREFEDMVRRVLGQDLSAGTDGFRDALLARCLAELDADARTPESDDGELEFPAASGNPAMGDAAFGDNAVIALS